MYDGGVWAVARYGVEALAHVERLCGAEGVQLLVHADFRLSALRHGFFQPFQELHQRHAVALHGPVQSCGLHFVAFGFQQGHRRGEVADRVVLGGHPMGLFVGFSKVGQDGAIVRGLQMVEEVFVRKSLYAIAGQIVQQFPVCLFRVDKQRGMLPGDQQVGDDHRIARDVVAADVECPGNLVEGGEQQGIFLLLFQALA